MNMNNAALSPATKAINVRCGKYDAEALKMKLTWAGQRDNAVKKEKSLRLCY
jgi:hypothetical protein